MPATRTNRLLIGAAAAIGVLAGAAGITAAVTGGTGTVDADVTQTEAEQVAVAEVPGTVVGYEHDTDDGRGVWSIDVEAADGTRHEVEVDSATGAVVAQERDDDRHDDDGRDDDGRDDDGDEGDPALAADAAVSQADAEATALAEVPGAVHRIHIEREDGLVVWDVEVDAADGTRHDLQIDATTGAVVEHDIDD